MAGQAGVVISKGAVDLPTAMDAALAPKPRPKVGRAKTVLLGWLKAVPYSEVEFLLGDYQRAKLVLSNRRANVQYGQLATSLDVLINGVEFKDGLLDQAAHFLNEVVYHAIPQGPSDAATPPSHPIDPNTLVAIRGFLASLTPRRLAGI